MNIALRQTMTVADYLAWGETQPERRRTELINGQVVAMAPERMDHVEIKFAAALALKQAIARAGVVCHALADGMTVRIDDYTAYEPDALVYGGERLARGSCQVSPITWSSIRTRARSRITCWVQPAMLSHEPSQRVG